MLTSSLRLADSYALTTFANGLRLILTPLPDRYSVTAAFYVGVGARYEPADIAGASHFLEHMLFKGSRGYPTPESISLAIEGVGGSLDAFTGDDRTGYIARVPAAHLRTAVAVVADMLRHPRLRASDVTRERRVIAEELAMIYDEPESWVGVLADQMLYGDHPLGRDILGTEESLRSMPRSRLVEHLAAYYRPNNTVVALAGDFDPAEAVDMVGAALGDWQAAPTPGFSPAPIPPHAPRVALHTRASEQAHVRLTTPGLSMLDPQRYTLQTLCGVLGAGMSCRLFIELRERAALAYNVYADDSYLHDTGSVALYAAVDPPKAVKAVRALAEQLDRLRQAPVPEVELQKTKEYLKGGILLRLEDTAEIAMSLASQAVVREEILTASDLVARVDAVTAQDVQRLAQRLFSRERYALAIVGPFAGPQRFERILKEVA
ncbi:MAG: insulinase family protein [Anaerolineae bacterium]|nr:insulinase family protein [Anaerolineae bacterium]